MRAFNTDAKIMKISRRGLFAGLAALVVSPKLASAKYIPADMLPTVFGTIKVSGPHHVGILLGGEFRPCDLANVEWRYFPKIYESIDHGEYEISRHLVFPGPCEIKDIMINGDPLAQLDRASGSGPEGQWFESTGDHQTKIPSESNKVEPGKADGKEPS